MQNVIAILSPSAPMAKAVSGPVTGPGADQCEVFGCLLSDGAAGDADDRAADSPSAVDGVAGGALPVPLWPGSVAKIGGVEVPGPASVEAAGRFGIRDIRPATVVSADVAFPHDIKTAMQSAPMPNRGGDVNVAALTLPLEDMGQLPGGPRAVETVIGEPGQTADRAKATSGALGGAGNRTAPGIAEPFSQTAIPVATASTPDLGLGRSPVDLVGQGAGAGRIGDDLTDTSMGEATGNGAGPIPGTSGIGAGLTAEGQNTPANLPVWTYADEELGKRIPAAPLEGMTAGPGRTTGEGLQTTADLPAGMGDLPEGARPRIALVASDGPPQASFWERLLSGMADTKTQAKATEDTAEPGTATGSEHRPLSPAAASTGRALSIAPVAVAPTRPDTADAVAPKSPGRTDPQPPLTAEPESPDKGRTASDATDQTVPAASGPHIAAEPAPSLATDLRDEVLALDPLREGFGDPAHLAAPSATPFAIQATLGPAAAPVTMPQLAAQVTAALSRGTEGETELALSPGELGHVRVKLKPDTANPDRLVVMITFERPETLDLFRRHAGELADALRAAGYAGADLGFGQQGSGQPDPRDHRAAQGFDGLPSSEPAGELHPPPRHSGAASLDLRL